MSDACPTLLKIVGEKLQWRQLHCTNGAFVSVLSEGSSKTIKWAFGLIKQIQLRLAM